jgi:hypothetical protein
MKPMGNWLVVAAAVAGALVTGCNPGARAFPCDDDTKCPGGRCEITNGGFCSFPDPSCPSGNRFGDLAGGQSNQCVGEQPIMVDAAIDGPPDVAIDARVCFGMTFPICLVAPPMGTLTVDTDMEFDTSLAATCAATMSGGEGLCVVAAANIIVSARLRGTGDKPLVLIASDSITFNGPNGQIDVGSHRGDADLGAGANPTTCLPGTLPGSGNGNGNGGGAGGSFTGAGGNGGVGGGPGGAAGLPAPGTANVTVIRGGCRGQDGNGTGRGVGGRGGGAVHLIAGNTISIAGRGINAGGEGGEGGVNLESGGGGGGSGGMIGLDAPTITNMAPLVANGGGGGEGADTNSDGNPGTDALQLEAAPGGNGAVNIGGNGGAGSAGAAAGAGATANSGIEGAGADDGGGGGGGGGAGLIKAPASANLGAQVSPARTP